MSGLPIRHEFSIQAKRLGDRLSTTGKSFQRQVRNELGISENGAVILLMGGGEGVGDLSVITEQLVLRLSQSGINATICAVCGRNETLKIQLNGRDWDTVADRKKPTNKDQVLFGFGTKSSRISAEPRAGPPKKGNVKVIGLGFVSRMAEYMVAADVLVSKAGPGTIAEAASVGLPVLLTSFLPGQESANPDFVLRNGFGDFVTDPELIGAKISAWLQSPVMMKEMVEKARETGRPNAAAEIVVDMGRIASKWMSVNEAHSSFLALSNRALSSRPQQTPV